MNSSHRSFPSSPLECALPALPTSIEGCVEIAEEASLYALSACKVHSFIVSAADTNGYQCNSFTKMQLVEELRTISRLQAVRHWLELDSQFSRKQLLVSISFPYLSCFLVN